MNRIRRWAVPILLILTALAGLPAKASESDALETFINTLEQVESHTVANLLRPDPLVLRISQRWRHSVSQTDDVVRLARQYSHPVFPKAEHILAVIAVESNFNPRAKNRGNVGLMQINIGANGKRLKDRSTQENVRVGAEILREYYLQLGGNVRGALLAYNAGIGNFLSGRYNSRYWAKFTRELAWVKKSPSI